MKLLLNTLKTVPSLIVLTVLLILITIPRFNRQDLLVDRFTGDDGLTFRSDTGVLYDNLSEDVHQYLLLVRYFRTPNTPNKSKLASPFSHRILTPFIASRLPFNEMTSLNLVNVFFLVITLFMLHSLMIQLGSNPKSRSAALMVFIFSFPTFYYSTIGYIDPGLIFFLALGTWVLFTEKWMLFPLVIMLGTMMKEGIVMLLPLALIVAYFHRARNKAMGIVFLSILVFIITAYGVRITFAQQMGYVWTPSYKVALLNLSRFRAIFSLLASWGIPGFFFLIFMTTSLLDKTYYRNRKYQILMMGSLICLAYCVYGIFSAYADGRLLWPAYVFWIPMIAVLLDKPEHYTSGIPTKSLN